VEAAGSAPAFVAFLSHFQKNSQDQVFLLSMLLASLGINVWFDMAADDLTLGGMMEGVANSKYFLLFLNDETLTRPFVLSELRRALGLGKRIVFVAESDAAFGARLGVDGRPDLDAYFEQAGPSADDVRALLGEARAGRIEVVPFQRDPAELEGMMRRVVAALGQPWPADRALPGASLAPKIQLVGNPANSIDQCLGLMAEFERKGHAAVVNNSGALVPGARVLVVFLNAGVFEVPAMKTVALAALAAGRKVVMVHEMDGRHGAVFNEDGGFDFRSVLSVAPFEVQALLQDCESQPMQRRGLFRAALVDNVLALAGLQSRVKPLPPVLRDIPAADVTLGAELGRGSFGVVLAGTWLRQPCALKTLHAAGGEGDLRKEGLFFAKLGSHPNMVNIHGLMSAADGKPEALVMELVEGGTLHAFVARGQGTPPPRHLALLFLADLLTAVEYLHCKGIFHRDIKPDNVLINSRYGALLTDLGTAKERSTTVGAATGGGPLGTYPFMAPELFDDDDRLFAKAPTDMYAVGVTMWVLQSGLVPFDGLSQMQIATAVFYKGKRPPTATLAPGPALDLVKQCWAKAPHDRLDASEARTAVQGLVREAGGEVRDSPGFGASLPQEFRIDFAAGTARASSQGSLQGAAEEAPAEIASFFAENELEINSGVAAAVYALGLKKLSDLLELDDGDVAQLQSHMTKITGKKFAKAVADLRVSPAFPKGTSI
jgi:hypothetical protein